MKPGLTPASSTAPKESVRLTHLEKMAGGLCCSFLGRLAKPKKMLKAAPLDASNRKALHNPSQNEGDLCWS